MSNKGTVRRTIIGGNNRVVVGANCTAYTHYRNKSDSQGQSDAADQGETVLIDFGYAGLDRSATGFDQAMPDAAEFFHHKTDTSHKPTRPAKALVITHGHGDHVGNIPHYLALGYELPPVYASRLTLEILRGELEDMGIDAAEWPQMHEIRGGDELQIGDFKLTAFPVSHSIPQTLAFGVEVGGHRFFETGDVKADQTLMLGENTDFDAIKRWAQKDGGVDALFLDATKAMNDRQTPTEHGTREEFRKVLQDHSGQRVVVHAFGGYLELVAGIMKAAAQDGRTLVIGDGSMKRHFDAMDAAGIDYKGLIKQKTGKTLKILQHDDPAAKALKPEDTLLLTCSSIFGESTALTDAAEGRPSWLTLRKDDVVLTNGLFRRTRVAKYQRLIAQLEKLGVTLYTHEQHPLDQAGHGFWPDLKKYADTVDAKRTYPVYGNAAGTDALAKKLAGEGRKSSDLHNGDETVFHSDGRVTKRSVAQKGWIFVRYRQYGRVNDYVHSTEEPGWKSKPGHRTPMDTHHKDKVQPRKKDTRTDSRDQRRIAMRRRRAVLTPAG